LFIKPSNFLKKTQPFATRWKGIVVDNADPRKLGRVKCQIPGLIVGTPEQLPWVFRRSKSFLGGDATSGEFSVPKLNSELIINFPFKDPYTSEYIGYWESIATHPTLFDENYPNTYGFLDEIGNFIKINKTTKEIKINHNSGTFILVKADGSLDLTGLGKLIATISGDITLTSVTKAKITAPKVEIGSAGVGTLDNRVKQDKAVGDLTIVTPVGPAAPIKASPQYSIVAKNTADLEGIKA